MRALVAWIVSEEANFNTVFTFDLTGGGAVYKFSKSIWWRFALIRTLDHYSDERWALFGEFKQNGIFHSLSDGIGSRPDFQIG